MTRREDGPLLMVTSPGGHLAHLMALRPWWGDRDRVWVTARTPDTEAALAGEAVVWCHWPTTRHLGNAALNAALAWRVVRRVRPSALVSDGAGIAPPFFLVAKALGVTTAYLECFDRIRTPSLSARLCYPLSDVFCVQWDRQLASFPRAVNIGAVL